MSIAPEAFKRSMPTLLKRTKKKKATKKKTKKK